MKSMFHPISSFLKRLKTKWGTTRFYVAVYEKWLLLGKLTLLWNLPLMALRCVTVMWRALVWGEESPSEQTHNLFCWSSGEGHTHTHTQKEREENNQGWGGETEALWQTCLALSQTSHLIIRDEESRAFMASPFQPEDTLGELKHTHTVAHRQTLSHTNHSQLATQHSQLQHFQGPHTDCAGRTQQGRVTHEHTTPMQLWRSCWFSCVVSRGVSVIVSTPAPTWGSTPRRVQTSAPQLSSLTTVGINLGSQGCVCVCLGWRGSRLTSDWNMDSSRGEWTLPSLLSSSLCPRSLATILSAL